MKANSFWIWSMLLSILTVFSLEQCSEGYFSDDEGCSKCHVSCKSCIGYTDCVICADNYAKQDSQAETSSCVWQDCPDGQFYSESLKRCLECEDSCSSKCAYQSHCFECPQGQYYDLDAMTCVDSCDEGSQIAVNDTMFGNMLICRSFDYYVNVDSLSVVELGTANHPYKDLSSVFVELLNLHSHSDRTIRVYIKEGTQNYLYWKKNYITNITEVQFMSYSSSYEIKKKAVIIGTDNSTLISVYVISTKFNILKDRTLRTNEKIATNTQLDENERSVVSNEGCVIMQHRSGMMLKDLYVTSAFLNDDLLTLFFKLVRVETHTITLLDCDFATSGFILNSNEPANVYFENLNVDMVMGNGGFHFEVYCDYPEATKDNQVYANNLLFYYSKETKLGMVSYPFFVYTGGGNVLLNNFTINAYSNVALSKVAVGLIQDDRCYEIDEEHRYKTEVYNFYLRVPFTQTISPFQKLIVVSFGTFFVPLGPYYDIIISNFTYEDAYYSQIGPLMFNYLTPINITLQNVMIKNFDSRASTFLFLGTHTLTLRNISFVDGTITSSRLIRGVGLFNVDIDGFYFSNVNFSPDVLLPMMNWEQYASLKVNDIVVSNSTLNGVSSLFYFTTRSTPLMAVSNVLLKDCIVIDTSIISVGSAINFSLTNVTIDNVQKIEADDTTSKIIDLEALSWKSNGQITIENVHGFNSSVGILSISNSVLSNASSQLLKISGVTVEQCNYTLKSDIIELGNIQATEAFKITMSDFTFSDIEFLRGGNILKFQHQTIEELALANVSFRSIYNGGITVESVNKAAGATKTKINISNMIASDIDGQSRSFIQLYEGASVQIHSSKFTEISNLVSGAVLMAGYQRAEADIRDSLFANNTSVEGGVFIVESESSIKCTNCTLSHNFAVGSGVIKANDDGVYALHGCDIYNNSAFYASISEIFSTQTPSLISSSRVEYNLVRSKEYIVESILEQDFIKDSFKEYVLNSSMLDRQTIKSSIQLVLGSLIVKNDTSFINQDYALYQVYSSLSVSDTSISMTEISKQLITSIESTLNVDGLALASISSGVDSLDMLAISYSSMMLNDISVQDCTSNFAKVLYSDGSLNRIYGTNITAQYFLEFRSSSIESISDVNMQNVKIEQEGCIKLYSSEFEAFYNILADHVNSTALYMKNSKVKNIGNIAISNSFSAIYLEESSVDILESSKIQSCGSSDLITSGGVYSLLSNIAMSKTTFIQNKGQNGAAIRVSCIVGRVCNTSISECSFINNTASAEGGAIKYDLQRPSLSHNTFEGNTAQYGNDIASYPVKIVLVAMELSQVGLVGVPSGLAYPRNLSFKLIDFDGQIMNLENENTIKVSSVSPTSKVEGIDSAKLTKGIASFINLILVDKPGSAGVQFLLTSNALNKQQIKQGLSLTEEQYSDYINKLDVSFRFCQPGEIISSDQQKCRVCSAGTYSFGWNSTECHNCIDNAVCNGGANIEVRSGYWRRTSNSTTLVQCLNEDACLGGFVPENTYPVECERGYKGYLCTECDIVDGDKYQPLPGFNCEKCPEPVLNAVKTIGLMLCVILFLVGIIYINVRKKKENQLSILLKILTNYFQLVSVALSFGAQIPQDFVRIFSEIDRIGYPSNTFFSFDCFIEDTEIKLFAPSNSLFKTFLLAILPLMLIIGACVLAFVLRIVLLWCTKRDHIDTKRHIVVSIICIIFLLHPVISLESLQLFQCIEIDEGVYRMKSHIEYECYSADHLLWACTLGLSMLLVWVIAMPALALYFLIRFRHKLDDTTVRKYMLLFYQGLKPKIFYWEFANTLRKLCLLSLIVFLSLLSITYQVLLSLVIMIILIRIQKHLQPYKERVNNEIEMLANIVGFLTIYCVLIFNDDANLHVYNAFLVAFLFTVHSYFILFWLLLIATSIKTKNQYFKVIVKILSIILCKKVESEEDAPSMHATQIMSTKKRKRKQKLKYKSSTNVKKKCKRRIIGKSKNNLEDETSDKNNNTIIKPRDEDRPRCNMSDFRLMGNDSISCFQLGIPEEKKVAKDTHQIASILEMNVIENYSNEEEEDDNICNF